MAQVPGLLWPFLLGIIPQGHVARKQGGDTVVSAVTAAWRANPSKHLEELVQGP